MKILGPVLLIVIFLLILIAPLLLFAADSPPPTPNPESLLAPLIALLGGNSGWLAAFVAWMGAARIIAKLFSEKLQEFLEAMLAWAKASADPKDDHIIDVILRNPFYKGATFLIDYLFSIKLPRAFSALCLCASVATFSGCKSPVPGTHFSGAIGGVPFVFDGHKQTTAEDVTLEVTTVTSRGWGESALSPLTAYATNHSRLHIGKLSSVNDPQVIDKSYAGQAAVTKSFFDGMNEFASKLVEGGVKGAK